MTTNPTPTRTHRSRRVKVAAAVGGGATAFALGAVAAFIGAAPIQGGVDSNEFSPSWQTVSVPAASQTDMTCTAGLAGGGAINLTAANAYPGGQCEVTGAVYIDGAGAETGKVVGLDLTLPTGWTATLLQGCGGTVPNVQQGGTLAVRFRVSMGATATPGSSSTFAATDGVRIAPTSTNAALSCTP